MNATFAQARELVSEINKVIFLANCYKQVVENSDRSNQSDEKFTIELEKYMSDPNYRKVKDALVGCLDSLQYDEVRIIQAIMYIGRDEQDPSEIESHRFEEDFAELYEEAERNGVFDSPQKKVYDYLRLLDLNGETRSMMIGSMVDKRDLSNYLSRGLKILRLQR